MKFTNSPFAIIDKNISALDFQKRNHIYEYYWIKEGTNKEPHKEIK